MHDQQQSTQEAVKLTCNASARQATNSIVEVKGADASQLRA